MIVKTPKTPRLARKSKMTEVLDPVEYGTYLEENRDMQVAVGKKWKNCHFPSLDLLKNWTGHGYLVWENEGKFDAKGNFQFFENFSGYEPLLVDLNSARLIVQIVESTQAGSEVFETKAKQQRSSFVRLANFCWKFASFR
jgi:hypothetical protein